MPIERVRVTKAKPLDKKTLADRLVDIVGSWNFIVGQTISMAIWVCINTATPVKPDPYPYILLNLLLSTQAALLGPIILMSNNRQGELDRKRDISHYYVALHDDEMLENLAMQVEEIHKHVEHFEKDC